MAKKDTTLSFKNAELSTNDNGEYILVETTKDDIKSFNLTSILDSLMGHYLTVSLKSSDELPPDEDTEELE